MTKVKKLKQVCLSLKNIILVFLTFTSHNGDSGKKYATIKNNIGIKAEAKINPFSDKMAENSKE